MEKSAIKSAIFEHPEFAAFIAEMNSHFEKWKRKSGASLSALEVGCQPREVIAALSEDLLTHYAIVGAHRDAPLRLVDAYDIYQHLMDYWAQTLQDDLYLIAADGWKAETQRIIETDKKGKEKDKGWTCDLLPKPLIVARYFAKEQAEIERLSAELEAVTARLAELEEEQGGEEGVFAEFEKVNKASVAGRVKELKTERHCEEGDLPDEAISTPAVTARNEAVSRHLGIASGKEQERPRNDNDELAVLEEWLKLNGDESELKRGLKDAEADLDAKAYAQYPKLSEAEIKTLAVEDKWLAALEAAIRGEMDRISQTLTQRVKELSERYETPMPQLTERVNELEEKVNKHLEKMGFSWR